MIRPTTTTPVAARRRRTEPAGMASGFTLVELLVVIVVLAILAALLLPAINAAVKTAKVAAVSSEINSLASALASFKSKYGDYPPSRILLAEDGDYSAATVSGSPSLATGDITLAQLAQRSVTALRRFFPRAQFNTNGVQVFPTGSTIWYDFNGDGVFQGSTHYILQGHECLVFFLGGIPVLDASSQTFGMMGFGKDPTNPFTNPTWATGANRLNPLFEFNGGRLYLDPTNTSMNGVNPGIPGYYDSFGNAAPVIGATPLTLNFYAYFSAYGNSSYDPNDVNFPSEQDLNGNSPIGLNFANAASYAPNPYTTTQTVGTTTGIVTFQSPQTFQIISSGVDGLYGVGGQYLQSPSTSASEVLPFDSRLISNIPVTFYGSIPAASGQEESANVRYVERDNVTNFKSGKLE
jgi:prepilin-type N-terminal cleavage/methylation domain-containing protein